MKSIKLSNNTYVHVFLHHINVSLEEAVISSETGSFPDFKQMANDYIDDRAGLEQVYNDLTKLVKNVTSNN